MIKILAIDDINDNLVILKAIINDVFPESIVYFAQNGPKGIELAIAHDPDVILLDILMPDMDGFEVCHRLKQDDGTWDIPVVFITALKADKQNRIKALEAGAEGFLSKPIDETELTAQIRAMVKIKMLNVEKREEKIRLAALVAERTHQLEQELEERTKAEKALKQSEERFQMLFNQAPLGYQSLDFDGNFIEVNQQWLDTLGYTRDEVVGKWFGDFLSPLYQDGFRKRFPIFKAQGHIHSEFEMVHKDGTKLFIAFEGKIGYDLKGDFKQTHCILQDITASKKKEDALKESQLLLQSSIESLKDTIVLSINQQYQYLYFNTFHKNVMMNAYGKDVKLGMDLLECITNDDDRKKAKINYDRALKGESHSTIEEYGVLDRYYYETRYNPIVNDKNEVIGATAFSSNITERKQAEELLRNTLSELKNSQKIAQVGNWKLDLSTDTFTASEEGLRLFGFPSGYQPKFQEISDCIHPEHRELVSKTFKHALQTKEKYAVEIRIFKKDTGEIRDILSIGEPQYGTNDEPIALVGTNQDITERKQAEIALRISEEAYKRVVNNVDEIIYSVSFNGNPMDSAVNFVSSQVEKVLGYAPEEFLQNPNLWFSLIHPDDLEMVIRQTDSNLERKIFEPRIYRMKHKHTNEYIWVEDHPQLMFDVNGYLTGQFGTARNITERKLAEKELRMSEEKHRTLFEQASDGIFIADSQGNYLDVNSSGCAMLGYSREEILKFNIKDLVTAENLSKNEIKFKELNTSGVIMSERELKCKNGTTLPVEISGKMLPDGRLQGIVRDITERKRSEYALLESNEFNKSLLQTIPFGMDIVDEYGNILFHSENFERIFGKDAIGRKCWELYRDDKQQCSDCPLRKGIEIGQTELYESKGVLGGKIFEISHTGMIFNGKKALLEIFQDITDRKKVEQALRESEETTRTLLDGLPESTFLLDLQGNIIAANSTVAKRIGYSLEELKGHSIYEFVPPWIANRRKQAAEQVIQTGQPIYFEDEINGHFIDNRIHPIFDQDGHVQRLAVIGMDITERKLAEERLRESEEKFSKVFRDAPVLIAITDINTATYLDVNEYSLQVSGFTREEVIGHTAAELKWIKAEDRILMLQLIQDKEKFTDIEMKFRAKDGHLLNGLVNGEQITIGGRDCLLTVTVDITERKKAEEDLRKSEEKYRTIFENVQDVFYQTDLSGNVLEISPSIKYFTDFSRDDIIGFSATNLYYNPNDRVTILNELMKKGEVRDFQLKIKTKANQVKYASINARLIFDSDGKPHRIDGAIRDVTERKLAEKQIQQLSRAIEQSTVSVVITNKEGEIEYCNPKVTDLTGYSFDELKGKNPRILKSGEQSAEFYKELWNTILSGNDWHGEFHNRRKNGELYWESAIISPIINDNEDITNFIAIKEDITESKKIIRELITAKKKAEEGDQLKSAFLANMSHEIRTPLNSIIGFSDLMLDPFFGPEQHVEFAGIIKENGNNLLTIISDIMDLSKIEAGQVQVKNRLFFVNQLITDIQKENSFRAIEKGIELRLDSSNPKDEIFIKSDETRIKQILINLVSNAIKFTEKGVVEIGIKTTGEFVQFHVNDTGIGIPTKYHDQIFERFRQVETAFTRKYGGNGLGLPISKSLVELLGGKIWMESEEGKGSTFFFTVPNI